LIVDLVLGSGFGRRKLDGERAAAKEALDSFPTA